ncbi:MAG: SsrA-binding protein SmpB [Bacteroidales bacterium]|nr:SsrA-binding protein SmpB [Bacteroidales bacterium]
MNQHIIIAKNKKAYFLYEIIETFVAGIVLTGSEIKSIRAGKINFVDSYGIIENGEAYIKGLHIAPYERGGYANHEPTRQRKLLLTKKEIQKIAKRIAEKGYTFIPLSCFINEKGYAKLEMGLARGKKAYDKREAIKQRDNTRENQRNLSDY